MLGPIRRYFFVLAVVLLTLYALSSVGSVPHGRLYPISRLDLEAKRLQNLPIPLTNASGVPIDLTLPRRANATFVTLCRNSDLKGITQSVEHVQQRFNNRFKYPWVFLNEEEFTEEFKQTIRGLIPNSEVKFGLIPREHWYQPDWIDEQRATNGRKKMVDQGIIYAESVPYRNMCRFNSGFFYRHELMLPYKYYWRVEPDVEYFCDIDYDPFLYMQDHEKIYGFTISFTEWEPTIPSLWGEVKKFISQHPEYVADNNAMDYLSNDEGETYNLCHFWSNFEIADADFWRSPAYTAFFEHLEAQGGFYYERWGDAPVHSIAAALFAQKNQLHFFRDIGYNHPPFQHCPPKGRNSAGKCDCSPGENIDYRPQSCISKFERLFI
ncbi:glycosyltransferase family 15 protein [Flagelloscypha sp. PMI_526]|nr:glycosyltransferase family 15 protein [Flagelloscypha sp. PMI_526]